MKKVDPTLRNYTGKEPRLVIPFYNKENKVKRKVEQSTLEMKQTLDQQQNILRSKATRPQIDYGMDSGELTPRKQST